MPTGNRLRLAPGWAAHPKSVINRRVYAWQLAQLFQPFRHVTHHSRKMLFLHCIFRMSLACAYHPFYNIF